MSEPASGPWEFSASEFNNDHHDDKAGSIVADGWIIAEVCGDVPGWQRHAALLKSAPDLLDALRFALTQCQCTVKERESGHQVNCFAPTAAEVIAKAEGR